MDIQKIKKSARQSVATIGIFDGMHAGHQKIVKAAVRRAGKLGLRSLAVTFDPHPLKLLEPDNAPALLISLAHRLKLLKELGVQDNVVIRFTKAFSRLQPDDFVRKVLKDALQVKELFIGQDFCLGKGRQGDAAFLKEAAKKYGFKVHIVGLVKQGGVIVSSTHLRSLITRGDLGAAQKLLKRPVSVLGTVVKGAAFARELGYPTANVNPHHEVIPPPGVYAIKIKFKGRQYGGILNIGTKPTFYKAGDIEPAIEAHIFGFKGDIYGKDVEIYFVKKLRDEKKFSSRGKLMGQIKRDEIKARAILKGEKI